jgi:hypothetical protein
MKTSLILDDRLFREAQREARRRGRTISETINDWARLGRDLANQSLPVKPVLRPVDLGGPAAVDLARRSEWMDWLDDDRARH